MDQQQSQLLHDSLEQLYKGNELTQAQCQDVFNLVMCGEVDNIVLS